MTDASETSRTDPAAASVAAGAPPLEVRGLVKRYGELTAVGGVDLTVHTGDVYGYLGPNGAGKTTSLRMMLGLIRPTEGSVRLFGRDPMESVRALEGVAGFVEAPTFYPYLSARRNLEMLAAYDGGGARERIDEALETVELTHRQRDRVGGFSHGMRQRLGIAAALLRDPKLLLLDEPATGLDPAGMRDMRLLIRRLADQGMTVLLSSHLLNEVEDVCNRLAIVRQGRIVYEGEIAELKRGAGTRYWLETTDDARALGVCRAQPGIGEVMSNDHGRISFTADDPAVAALSQALVESGALIRAMAPQTVTLEDLFFSLTEGEVAAPAPGGRAPSPEPAEAAR
ncbi:MAG TPA: ATP-binding cassette domain-containing protein [Solirubrobacteraceae bacterium]|nr:ATP-binding cassette domain-containing protein [Solirubrobacteraceae bacterium]